MGRFPVLASTVILLALATPAFAGAFGKLDLAGTKSTPTDCSNRTPITEEIPWWSHLQWSLAGGVSSRPDGDRWDHAAVLVPQASLGFVLSDSRCGDATGWFTTDEWVRWSLGFSADAAWRSEGPDALDVRPALRLSRENYLEGFLTFGTSWVPSYGVALAAGPTFDPALSGAAVSLSTHLSLVSIEVRAGWRTEDRGEEILLLFGLTDIHGFVALGDRER
jgi:hypothetical protein